MLSINNMNGVAVESTGSYKNAWRPMERHPPKKNWQNDRHGICIGTYMDVSKHGGTPKSSILIGFSIINHPFWGTRIFGNTHMVKLLVSGIFMGI